MRVRVNAILWELAAFERRCLTLFVPVVAFCFVSAGRAQQDTNYVFITLAGQAGVTNITDGLGLAARFDKPFGVAVDDAGNAYVADTFNHTVRKITPSGMVTTLAGQARSAGTNDGAGIAAMFAFPIAVAVDTNYSVYVADWGNSTIRKIAASGQVTTLAGQAGSAGTNDGVGIAARFNFPYGVSVDATGQIYVADTANHTIRKITPDGAVTTLAGKAQISGTNDGVGVAARFSSPRGVAVDGSGTVYVADTSNQTIRKITQDGTVTTLAGLAGASGTNDGSRIAARFASPGGLSLDLSHNILVADIGNHTIRRVTPAGVVTTVAGKGGDLGSNDGVASAVRFYSPEGVAIDSATNIYVADTSNHTVRKGWLPPPPNDAFSNRFVITGLTATVNGFNIGATKEAGESNHAGNVGGKSVWWTWTAPADGTVSVDTIGSSFDTVLAIYTGTSVSQLTLVASDNNSGSNLTSRVTFLGTAGTVYQIAVDGYNSTNGIIVLNVGHAPQVTSNPQSKTVLEGANVVFRVTAEGTAPLSYQWQFNGTNLARATNEALYLFNVTSAQAGQYSVMVSNILGTVTSAVATLTGGAPTVNVGFKGNFPGFTAAPARDVQVMGNLAYLAIGTGMLILDISDPTHLRRVGGYETALGDTYGIAVVGRYAYLAKRSIDNGGGLEIVDISNPVNPVRFGGYAITNGCPSDVAVGVRYAYIANGLAGLEVVSNAANPVRIGGYDTAGLASAVQVTGDYAYVADDTNGLEIIDISDPTNCVRVGGYKGAGQTRDVKVVGNYAYVADGTAGLEVLDVRSPASPVRVGGYDTAGFAQGVFVVGNYAYLADDSNGLQVIEVSDPTNCVRVAAYPGRYSLRVQVADGRAYVVNNVDGLEIIDVQNPANPSHLARFPAFWDVSHVSVSGNYAYLANSTAGLQVLDVSDPGSPVLVGSYGTSGFAQDVETVGQVAYVASGIVTNGMDEGSLEVIDVSDPGNPVRVGGCITTGFARAVRVVGHYAFVANIDNGLDVLDVSNPTNCTRVGGYGNVNGVDVDVVGHYAFLLDYYRGLLIVDVSDPTNCVRVASIDTGSGSQAVHVAGNYAYVAGLRGGLQAIDISNPTSPVSVGGFDVPFGGAEDVDVVGKYAFVAQFGLNVLDVTNPTNLIQVGSYDTCCFEGLEVVGNFIFVAHATKGLTILDLGPAFAIRPGIGDQPNSRRALAGTTTSFYVAAKGTVPLSYQWRFNGTNIPGGTQPLLRLRNVQFSDAGQYSVVVSNSIGSTVSSNAQLSVDFPPSVVLRNPEPNSVFMASASITLDAEATDSDGSVAQVEFYERTNLLGVVTNRPFTWTTGNMAVGTYAFKARATDNEGARAESSPVTVTVTNVAVFQLSKTDYTVNESDAVVTVKVRRNVGGAGSVTFSTFNNTAKAVVPGGVGQYYAVSNVLVFAINEMSKDIQITNVNDLVFRGDKNYLILLSSPSPANVWQLADPTVATVTILDDESTDANLFPDVVRPINPLTASGSLTVLVEPPEALGKWRLAWDQFWRESGSTASNLVAGDYPVRFSALDGYIPLTNDIFTVTNGQNVYTKVLENIGGTAGLGSLGIRILPAAVANAADEALRGQWHLQGDSSTNWNDSGVVISGQTGRVYVVEFKPVPGFETPPEVYARIIPNQTTIYQATYSTAATSLNVLPNYFTVTNEWQLPGYPYAYCGQLFSDAGYGSGFVVKKHTVLTAAHMVFDPVSLSYMDEVWWFFQRQAGEYEPPPLRPRGWYVLEGYASARTNDILGALGLNSNQSSTESYKRDVAALFFGSEGAGKGGYGGYLTSVASNHIWLEDSNQKLLVGYPVQNVPEQNRGKMHRGGPGIAAFEQVSGLSPELYQTPDLIGYPGMSGGPVCVLSYTSLSNLFLLPAAVYLGELENGQSLARVIDLDVVNLINSAEDSATLGTDHTGGGVVLINAAYGGDIQNPGIVEVHLGPSAAIRAGGAWRVSPTNYGNLFYRTNYTTNSLNLLVQSANFGIEVKQLDGFITPTSLPIKVVEDAIVPLELMYSVPQPWLTYNWSNGVGFTTTGAVSTVYGIEFASHLPGDALNDWTMLTKVTNYPSLGGTNWIWIPNTAPTSVTNRLFRARWLTD